MSLAVLLGYLGAVVSLVMALLVCWGVKRAVRERLIAKHAGGAGPLWILSAGLVVSVAVAATVRCLAVERQWVDPCLLSHLVPGGGSALSLVTSVPLWSAYWLGAVSVAATVLYVAAALLAAWLLEPPPAQDPEEPPKAVRGLPPPSAAPSARQAGAGPLRALDEAAGAGVTVWLYRNLGYWRDPRQGAEPRFRLWLAPLVRALTWLKWVALPIAATGLVSALAWAAAAVILDALDRVLDLPPLPKDDDEEEAPAEAEELEAPSLPLTDGELERRLSTLASERGSELRRLGTRAGRGEEHGPEGWPGSRPGDLMWRVVEQWGGGRPLWAHQYEAATRFEEAKDLLLETAPPSGRTTLVGLAVIDEVLCRGGTALWIVPDTDTAESVAADLVERGAAAGWRWSVSVVRLTGEASSGLDPLLRQPTILVATVDALESQLMPLAGQWDRFFASLSLIAITDVERHHGPRSAALGRLGRRIVALGALRGVGRPAWLLTASGLWPDAAVLAQELTGRRLDVVGGSAEDGAPVTAQSVFALMGGAPSLEELQKEIELAGWACAVVDSDLGLRGATSTANAAQKGTSPGCEALIVEASTGALPRLHEGLRHLPRRGGEGRSVVVWATGAAPLGELLVGLVPPATKRAPLWSSAGPALARGLENSIAAGRDLRRALSEREMSRSELASLYGDPLAEMELGELTARGSISERRAGVLSPLTGLPQPTRLYRLTDPSRPRSRAAVVTDNPVSLVEASTGMPLLHVDRVRADAALYPGLVVVAGDRRFKVRDQASCGDSVMADAETEAVWSAPVRRAELELDRWSPRPWLLGGEGVSSGVGPVTVDLRVEGVRRFDPGGALLDERTFGEPRTSRYDARALVVRFPQSEADPGGSHGVAHLLRACLPLVLEAGPLDVDVICLPASGDVGAGIAIVDLHPGGAGYADGLGPSGIRRLFEAALELGRAAPAAAAGPPCHSPVGALPPPAAESAVELLERVLGAARSAG